MRFLKNIMSSIDLTSQSLTLIGLLKKSFFSLKVFKNMDSEIGVKSPSLLGTEKRGKTFNNITLQSILRLMTLFLQKDKSFQEEIHQES